MLLNLFGGMSVGNSGKGTAWDLFNSVTQLENHERITKKPSEYSILMGNRSNTMQHAYNVLKEYVEVER